MFTSLILRCQGAPEETTIAYQLWTANAAYRRNIDEVREDSRANGGPSKRSAAGGKWRPLNAKRCPDPSRHL